MDKVISREQVLTLLSDISEGLTLGQNSIENQNKMVTVMEYISQLILDKDVEEALEFFNLDECDAAILYETEGHPTEAHYKIIMKHHNVLKQALELGQQYKADAHIERGLREEAQSKLTAIKEYIKIALRDVLDAKEYALKTKNETKYKELQARHLALGEVNQVLRGDEVK